MTTTTGRPSRDQRPQMPVGTIELLTAVRDLGPNWPARFGDHEIVEVAAAVDRELLAGNLIDGATLSAQGRKLIEEPPTT